GAGESLQGVRVDAPLRGGDGAAPDARADGGGAGGLRAGDPAPPEVGALRRRQGGASALADDRPAHSQGVDRSQGGGRPQGGGILAGPSGAAGRREEQSSPPEAARGMAQELQAGGALRRCRQAQRGAEDSRSQRGAADERQPPRQRRLAAQGAAPS